jgi:hypothetical protein
MGAGVASCAHPPHGADPGSQATRQPVAEDMVRPSHRKSVVTDCGVRKLTATVGRYADGLQRRVHTTAHAPNMLEANRALARFVAEVRNSSLPAKS